MFVPYKCLLKAVQSGAGSRAASARDKLSGKGKNLMGRGVPNWGGRTAGKGKNQNGKGKYQTRLCFLCSSDVQ